MMNDITLGLLAWLAGILLGAVFFGGLWWTVRKAVAAKQPALWFLVSLLLRTGITLTGFYWVAGDAWQRLVLCLLGFVMMRVLVVRLSQAKGLTTEACHAPES
ncbi:ATP synthase subunit I [Methylovulum psychrotolerans]|jgi:F1F0 ATPase subunit 2|nr:ATP synthase subunit I [Methylovulum psychrotolerans]